MSFITKIVLERGFINSYYGCQLVCSVKATPELIKKYGLGDQADKRARELALLQGGKFNE